MWTNPRDPFWIWIQVLLSYSPSNHCINSNKFLSSGKPFTVVLLRSLSRSSKTFSRRNLVCHFIQFEDLIRKKQIEKIIMKERSNHQIKGAPQYGIWWLTQTNNHRRIFPLKKISNNFPSQLASTSLVMG